MKKIYILLLLVPFMAVSQSKSKNYIKTRTYVKPSTQAITGNDTIVGITYYDGLGRPTQTIAARAGGSRQDIVTPIVYDAAGRQSKSYLPYADAGQTVSSPNYRDNAGLITTLNGYYQNKFPGELSASAPNPYSETFYEDSPLARPLKQGAPGQDWMGHTDKYNPADHTVKFAYGINTTGEVYNFDVAFTNNNTETPELTLLGHYLPGQLYKSVTKDENWTTADGKNKTTEEFTDKQGKVLLKRTYNQGEKHDTYYVYDKFSNLTYVIPPLASADIATAQPAVLNPAGVNYPWTRLARVDAALAASYERDLAAYDNADILNADLSSRYGGQGGFNLTPDGFGGLTLTLNIATTQPMELATGSITELKNLGTFEDRELGRIRGTGYEYIFLLKDNRLTVEGKGPVPSLNATLSGSSLLEYSKNYAFTHIYDIDPQDAKNYDGAIANLDNAQILSTYTPNPYQGLGGVAMGLNADNTLTLTFNVGVNAPLKLKTGAVITFDLKRALPDMDLGGVSGTGYSYRFSLRGNTLFIDGAGTIQNLTYSITKQPLVTYTIKQPAVDGLCYIYNYDSRNRVVRKKVPGKGWESIIYDKLDRPVMVQDANMALTNLWLFTKYDATGRVAYTGQVTNSLARSIIQNTINGQVNPVWHEKRTTTTTFTSATLPIQYTNNAYPKPITNSSGTIVNGFTVLTVNYYDTYGYDTTGLLTPSGNTWQSFSDKTKGLPTGVMVRVPGTDSWTKSYTKYDDKGRGVMTMTRNTYLGSLFTLESQYDFAGRVVKTKTQHEKTNVIHVQLLDDYTYDHMGRLLMHKQNKDGSLRTEIIAANKYDELGQLIAKKAGYSFTTKVNHSYDTYTPLQVIDYSYNIRGWLRGINNVEDNLSLSSNTDLFAFGIRYNNASGMSLYNGNISSTSWKSKADNQKRSYIYSYDAMNRLNTATFTQDTAQGSPWPAGFNRYDEKGITYDKNGNILSLERRGLVASSGTTDTFGVMDKLTYTYGQYTNRLDRVKDDAPASAITGFTDGVDTALEYHYDANGNMVKDFNKKIGTTSTNGITYNYLNLPLTITIEDASTLKKIEYVYDAVGTKLKKTVTTGTSTETTEYDSGFVFYKTNATANKLQFFATEEGYATQDSNTADIKYTYQYKDHLGNVRLSYTDTNGNNAIVASEVIEESNYYPFGLKHGGYNKNTYPIGNSTAQKWKYNDTEYNESFALNIYEMPLRSYDPALARWTTIDPVVHYSMSTYNGYDNNPVFWADPSGADAYAGSDFVYTSGSDAQNLFSKYLSAMENGEESVTLRGNYVTDPLTEVLSRYDDLGNGLQGSSYQEVGAKINEVLNFSINIIQRFKGSGIDPYAEVSQTNPDREIQRVIDNVIGLKKYWEVAGSPNVKFAGRSSEGYRGLSLGGDILIYNSAFSSYVWLASTLFHEISHAYQNKYFSNMSIPQAERQAYGTEWRLAPIHLKTQQSANYSGVWRNYYIYSGVEPPQYPY